MGKLQCDVISKNSKEFVAKSKPNISNRENRIKFNSTLFELAAKAVENTNEGSVGFKDAFYKIRMDKKFMRPAYGIGSKVMRKWKKCEEILEDSGILNEHPDIDKNLVRVLVVELLWGNKHIFGNGEVSKIVQEKREILKKLRGKHTEVIDNELNISFARVNTIKTSVKIILVHLEELGYTLVDTPSTYKKYLQEIVKLEPKTCMIDFHFKDLFVFNSREKSALVSNAIVYDKFLTFQNKSSLIPVHLMGVKPGNTVLDMCAAPGMKTAIIAAHLQGQGDVWAVDNNKNRYQTMVKNLKDLGAKKIAHCTFCDVLNLKSNPENFDLILLDAPCSGSGIVERLGETDNSVDRLRKLQWIQIKLLTNALTKYPNVKRVVYSTCSINPEENEAVVDEVMEKLKGELTYKLVDSHKLISGFLKGSKDYKCGASCIRVTVERDFACGFFVAVFDKDMTKIKPEVKSPETKKAGNKRKHAEVVKEEEESEDEEDDESDEDEEAENDEEGEDEEAESDEDEEEMDDSSDAENSIDIPEQKVTLKQKKGKESSSIETPAKKMRSSHSQINKPSKTKMTNIQKKSQAKIKMQKKSLPEKNNVNESLEDEISKKSIMKSKRNKQKLNNTNTEVKSNIPQKQQKNAAKKMNARLRKKNMKK